MAAALVLAASCNKQEENIPSVEGNVRVVINGVAESIGSGTKADMVYSYEVIWREGDQIYVTNDGKEDTFTLTDGEDTPRGVFSEDNENDVTGDIEAFYPASLKTDDGYLWPAVQTNSQVVPMYAAQTISGTGAETVSFSSLGAMLQIVFNTPTPDITVTSVTIRNASKPLSGMFTVSDGMALIDDDAENVGITLDLGTGIVMGKSAKYFNIAIPAGEYEGDEIILSFNDSKKDMECVMTSTTFPDIERNTVGRITVSGSFKGRVPSGALPGVFTVDSSGKKVYFSKGNLHATYSSDIENYTWAFADHQYDYVGNVSGNTTIDIPGESPRQSDGAKVDMFGWRAEQFGGKGSPVYYGISTSTNSGDYGLPGDISVDWGSAIDDKGTWRPLSIQEWQYLFNTRTVNGGTDKGKTYSVDITYGGKMGLVIYPDDYTGDPVSGIVTELPEGVVFLPAAGFRNGSQVNGVGELGYYWTSTVFNSINAWYVKFNDSSIYLNDLNYRFLGFSVRLVSDVKE